MSITLERESLKSPRDGAQMPQAQLLAGDGTHPWTKEGEAMPLIPFARLLESADVGKGDKDGTHAGGR